MQYFKDLHVCLVTTFSMRRIKHMDDAPMRVEHISAPYILNKYRYDDLTISGHGTICTVQKETNNGGNRKNW